MANLTALAFVLLIAKSDSEECLIWPFSRDKKGYARVSARRFGTDSAARAVCIQAHGEPPTDNHEVAHSCGKGHLGCVTPNHLRWATRTENMTDKIKHGTMLYGERNTESKLTEAQVIYIRSVAGTISTRELGKTFGVSAMTVSKIQTRRKWKHLP